MNRSSIAAAFVVAMLAVPAWAQTPAEHDSHHPSDNAKSGPTPATPPAPGMNAPQGGMGGMMGNMPMMGMMNDMKGMMSGMAAMNSMSMMQSMGMMGSGMGGMATIDRIEGRIAFLRAELKITDAQAGAWNALADTLRANARKLADLRAAMMSRRQDAQQKTPTTSDRLDQQEQWLLARLEGTRAMKSAFARLNEVLSDEQKKTADDLLAPHMGMGMMAMMPARMPPGGMGPGAGMSGRMRGWPN